MNLKRFHNLLPLFIISLVLLGGLFLLPDLAWAQDENLETVAGATGLQNPDLIVLIGNIIHGILLTLGVIALIITLWGGFRWMTAGGNPEKVATAKKILINGAIGLAIILASYAIVSFVLNALLNATGGGGEGEYEDIDDDGGLGGSNDTIFKVTAYRPDDYVSQRNIILTVTFSQVIDTGSLGNDAIIITERDTGEQVAGTIVPSTSNKLTFTPSEPCPEPNSDRFCFAEDTTFDVVISADLASANGQDLSCLAGAGCESSFSTGNVVDTTDPDVSIEYPEANARLQPGLPTLIQIHATDDGEVAGGDFFIDDDHLDSVPASGPDYSDVLIETTWNTLGWPDDQSYEISATASDICGNSQSRSIRVRLNPAHCYNGVQDEDETGLDCGGSCGACDGDSCTESGDCGGDLQCLDGVCTSAPKILGVSPQSGAPGTYVTIAGRGFGNVAGTVYFSTPDGGQIAANVPACAAGWRDDEVVVELPVGAATGPIILATDADLRDATNDDWGPLIADFEVNDVETPSLCRLSPTTGLAGMEVRLSGLNFGASQADSMVYFGSREAVVYAGWGDTEIRVNAPSIPADRYQVGVIVDGVESNRLSYTLVEEEEVNLPTIQYSNPENGGVGQYVTLYGSGFGGSIGTVWFENLNSHQVARGSIDFPDECLDRFWSDAEVKIIVPETYLNPLTGEPGSVPLAATTHGIYLETYRGETSNTIDFSVTSAAPSPGICAIEPDSGEEGDAVYLYGAGFGASQGSGNVSFYNEAGASTVNQWDDEVIEVSVPASAATGPVDVTNNSGAGSNGVNFEISSEQTSLGAEGEAEYVWTFSTGIIPTTPSVIIACRDDQISGVPNAQFTDDVCQNAIVKVDFSTLMKRVSFDDGETVIISECADVDCSNQTAVEGILSLSDNQAFSTLFWVPAPGYNGGRFRTETQYQITLTTGLESTDSIGLGQDVSWQFQTGSASTDCAVDQVRVSPDSDTIKEEGGTSEFNALASTNDCQVLNPGAYNWDWSVDYSIADLDYCAEAGDACREVIALREGESPVQAREMASNISGEGTVIIDYTDPYVVNYMPDCDEACLNAAAIATFNVPMDRSIETTGMVTLLECTNELCSSYVLPAEDETAKCLNDQNGDCTEVMVNFSGGRGEAGTYYRVIVSGEVMSESGVELTRPNFGSDFSWIFRTREDAQECNVDRIELLPAESTLSAVGTQQTYVVESYGEADACSEAGQRLNSYNYNWSWQDPIVDDEDVAAWRYVDGELVDGTPGSPKAGCTSSCLAVGSEAYYGICGADANGDGSDLDPGEDCDDGNVASGDGCSASCLAEGSVACAKTCSDSGAACSSNSDCEAGATCQLTGTNCCGNGILERNPTTLAGEECDDGNTSNNDGCSASCLNEGSRAAGVTCGNSDIGYSATTGGEDCDDGNSTNGDGCSSSCLNEGSPAVNTVDAVCGDGSITTPYETCDDGNTQNGDGCSDQCLREGANTFGTCGNGVTERKLNGAGEDCDGQSGCSDECLELGSSVERDPPSVCGNGRVGSGEMAICESGVAGDGLVDPAQQAIIMMSAPEQVDPVSQLATATIQTRLPAYGLQDQAALYLECSAANDTDCPQPNLYGQAENKCCMERPDQPNLFPASGNACTNSAIYALFDQEMDLSTFAENMYIELDTRSGITCPAEYQGEVALAEPSGFLARVWSRVKLFFARVAHAQVSGDCRLPIDRFTQTRLADDLYLVQAHYNVALVKSATYTINVLGDERVYDRFKTGVLSASGVGVSGSTSQEFTTSASICTIDEVEIVDTSAESPRMFTSIGEQHTFEAMAYSHEGSGKQAIVSIPGLYEWEWEPWLVDDPAVLNIDEDRDEQADISAPGLNGEATIVAAAQVTVDSEGASTHKRCGAGGASCETSADCDEGVFCQEYMDQVSGSLDVIAMLCEHPWPAPEDFPFIDDETATLSGVVEGSGWMNFSTYYCRDAGETGFDDDLPGLRVITPPESNSPAVLKEYLFQVEGSSDAIGLRIVKNEQYLSPSDWYTAQGFAGSPEELEVDGFDAIKDGRTIYISAPNKSNSLYSNIYVISYNEGADEDAQTILTKLTENFTLITNLSDTDLCHDGTGYVNTVCNSDLDCARGEECGSLKDKLRRDNIRLHDIRTIENALATYGAQHGLCSATTAQACTGDGDCPTGESCIASVPTLQSGTYVRAMSSSAWESWNSSLAGALGALPQDPLNQYAGCGDGLYTDYDAATCTTSSGVYVCPRGSYTYHYRSIGPFAYELYADLEYLNDYWVFPIDLDTADDYQIWVRADSTNPPNGFTAISMCNGRITYGDSDLCGDGLVGPNEACEIGQTGATLSCDASPDVDRDGDGNFTNDNDGNLAQTCNSSCTGFTADPAGQCVSNQCGDGVINIGEECDDGSYNGAYGFCGSDCTYGTSFYCGDGSVAGGEVCDCGTVVASGLASGGESCVVANGVYKMNPDLTCAWDCAGPASYCGDGIVDSREECDLNDDTWSGALCVGGDNQYFPCQSDTDCPDGACGSEIELWAQACPETSVCISGESSLIGYPCANHQACGTDAQGQSGICSPYDVPTVRTRTCGARGEGNGCEWNQNSWKNIDCVATSGCGNGQVEDGEECDDGNEINSDACTNYCTINVCGDGFLFDGVEECDDGKKNGQACSAAYGSVCTYCSSSCQVLSSSGSFCGNGQIDGEEFCDAVDLRYYWYNATQGTYNNEACEAAQVGTTTQFDVDGTLYTFTCANAGACNGGTDNGQACLSDGDCEGDCVFPSCADNCAGSCPFSSPSKQILVESNLEDAQRASSIEVQSFDPRHLDEVLTLPTGGNFIIPACTIADRLTADVEFNGIEVPDTWVVFVTDLSGGMNNNVEPGVSRLDVVRQSLLNAGEILFDSMHDKVHIGLAAAQSDNAGLCSVSGTICDATEDCPSPNDVCTGFPQGYFIEQEGGGSGRMEIRDDVRAVEFMEYTQEALFVQAVNSYWAGMGVYIYDGFDAAREMFQNYDNNFNSETRKIIVLMSQGDWQYSGHDYDDPAFMACKAKADGIELFTIGINGLTPSILTEKANDCSRFAGYDNYDDWAEHDTAQSSNCSQILSDQAQGLVCPETFTTTYANFAAERCAYTDPNPNQCYFDIDGICTPPDGQDYSENKRCDNRCVCEPGGSFQTAGPGESCDDVCAVYECPDFVAAGWPQCDQAPIPQVCGSGTSYPNNCYTGCGDPGFDRQCNGACFCSLDYGIGEGLVIQLNANEINDSSIACYDVCRDTQNALDQIEGGGPGSGSIGGHDMIQGQGGIDLGNNKGNIGTVGDWLQPTVLGEPELGHKFAWASIKEKIVDFSVDLVSFWRTTIALAAECADGYTALSYQDQMACWSSGNPDPDKLVDYALNGDTAEEITEMYLEIVDAILGIKLTYSINPSNPPYGNVASGNSVELPWPTGFSCDPYHEQTLPFNIFYEGDGTVTLKNIRLEYCAP